MKTDKSKKSRKAKRRSCDYAKQLYKLQVKLIELLEWIKAEGERVVVIFEGRDASGKGGTIKRITHRLNPRSCRVVALPSPTEREKTQWYFQRYVKHLPASGEMVLFDRSWYNRCGVERVMDFCTDAEYNEFLRSCPEFENMLARSGMHIVKYWFSISTEEQERRFLERANNPTKRWKLSKMDMASRTVWEEYSKAKDTMISFTDIKRARWYIVNSNNKRSARLNCINHLINHFPHEPIKSPVIKISPRPPSKGYIRPPYESQNFVNEKY